MNAKNIFKMEFYRNFRDKSWLVVIGAMSILAFIDSILIIKLINETLSDYSQSYTGITVSATLAVFLTLFLGCGIWVFKIIYPFHLLSVDYSNKALGLMVGSGVNRLTYYFIKLFATILSTILGLVVILIIPFFLVLGVYARQFSEFLMIISHSLSLDSIWLALINSFVSALASIIILFFVVIMARGRFWGIFVYLGITMAVGLILATITSSMSLRSTANQLNMVNNSWVGIIFSVIEIIIFGLVGISLIRKQDL